MEVIDEKDFNLFLNTITINEPNSEISFELQSLFCNSVFNDLSLTPPTSRVTRSPPDNKIVPVCNDQMIVNLNGKNSPVCPDDCFTVEDLPNRLSLDFQSGLSSTSDTSSNISTGNSSDSNSSSPPTPDFQPFGSVGVLPSEFRPIEDNLEESLKQSKRKRENSSRVSQQERHKSAEKKRRSSMNDLLSQLKEFLPSMIANDSKLTKIGVLHETVERLSYLQAVCSRLTEENNRLKEELALEKSLHSRPLITTQRPEFSGDSSSHNRSSNMNRNNNRTEGHSESEKDDQFDRSNIPTRPVLLAIFLMFMLFMPNFEIIPFSGEETPSTSVHRSILSTIPFLNSTDITHDVSGHYSIWQWLLCKYIKWTLVSLVSFFILALGEQVKTSEKTLFEAKEAVQKGEYAFFSGQFSSDIRPHFHKALLSLERIPPKSRIFLFIAIAYQVWRRILHKLGIGLFIERKIYRWKQGSEDYASLVISSSLWLLRVGDDHHYRVCLEWLYIAISSINDAAVFGLSKKMIELEAICSLRVRGSPYFFHRIFSAYIEWELSSCNESSLDHDIEYRACTHIGKAKGFLLEGKIKEAKAELKKSFDLSVLSTENHQASFIVHPLSFWIFIGLIEDNQTETFSSCKALLKLSFRTRHNVGQFIGLLALSDVFLLAEEVDKAEFVMNYLLQQFSAFRNRVTEHLWFRTLKASLEFLRGQFEQSFKEILSVLKEIRTHNDNMFFIALGYYRLSRLVLSLWKESLKESSVLKGVSCKLSHMSHELFGGFGSLMDKASRNLPNMQVKALMLRGEYYLLLRSDCWANRSLYQALQLAEQHGLQKDIQIIKELLKSITPKSSCIFRKTVQRVTNNFLEHEPVTVTV